MALTKIINEGIGSASAIAGEGTATTNLQQGLAKAWVGSLDTSAVEEDKFNFTNFTDNGDGDNTCNFTNNMANIGYSSVASCDIAGTVANRLAVVYEKGTSLFKIESFIADTAGNSGSDQNCTIHGDLA
tara:strand:- start:144 stop:530 length:387 start_codon:yes stop_codon:yes gene_type:complete